jgi:hypothetical protein
VSFFVGPLRRQRPVQSASLPALFPIRQPGREQKPPSPSKTTKYSSITTPKNVSVIHNISKIGFEPQFQKTEFDPDVSKNIQLTCALAA